MAAADYRVMTDATGQRIAAALEGMSDEAVKTTDIANNLTTTTGGKVLDARQGKALADKLDATQSAVAIIIDGNQTTHAGGVAVGEFVLVRNSTISGITDGLYKATQSIPANTAIDSTYLTAVDGGGLNAINNHLTKIGNIGTNIRNNFSTTFTATEAGTYLIIVRAAPTSGSDALACTINVNNSIIAHQMCPAGTPLSMACCAILSVNDVVSLSPTGSMDAFSNDYRTAWQVIRIG